MSSNPRDVVTRIVNEVINGKNLALIDELYAPNYVGHQIPPPLPQNREGQKLFVGAFFEAFPDMRLTFEQEVIEGNRIAGLGYFTGTHKGPFNGIPPTGKRVQVSFMDLWRVENGKLAEYWGIVDVPSLLKQLGVMP